MRHACSQPQPAFPARRRPLPSGLAGAVKAAPAPRVARGALTAGARQAARLAFRLAGLGFFPCRLGAPGGRRGAGAARSVRKPRGFCG